MARRSKDIDQQELPQMESPKNIALERIGKKYRGTIATRLSIQRDEKNQKAKIQELMHKAHASGEVRRVTIDGADCLVYQRANINITVKITEKVKVLLDDEVANDDNGDPNAVVDDDDVVVDEN